MGKHIIRLSLLAASIGLAGLVWANTHEDGEQVRVISQHEIIEKLDGKEATATVVEVIIEPGKRGLAHRHPGPAIVYVLEGTYELGIDNKPTEMFKAGETFYEPSGCLHSVSRNPSNKERCRLIATVLHPRDAKDIATPEVATEHPKEASEHAME